MLKRDDRIGPYQLIAKLGSGTFGVVWKAKNVEARKAREVALKIPRDEEIDLKAIDEEAEIWIAASGHPNVLPFIEAGLYNGYVVIASEYAPDGSLQGWLNRHGGQAPSIEAAVEMTRGILAGLEHLHQRGIIHRDLKPDNILLQGETPRLADFGISRVVKSTSLSANLAGTPAYMAPEAFQRKRNEQTDVWSVGVMLYQMLTGQLPFEGDDLPTACVAVRDQEMPPLPATIPAWLREVVARALAKDPAQRYQSALEMRRDLSEAKQRHEQAALARQRQQAEQQQRAKEAQLQAERERLLREVAELRRLAEKQRQSDAAKQTVKIPLPPTPQPDKRARTILIAVALTLLVGLSLWGIPKLLRGDQSGAARSSPESSTSPVAATKTFSFQTVTLDARGKEVARETKWARYFTEDLGNGVTLEMVEIPGGTFTMGSPASETDRDNDEGPQHRVTVPAFFMGRFEVTQAQWRAVMGGNLPNFKGDKLPVEDVLWNEAKEFCSRLKQKTGRDYRLPSEAEWEYACRAGTTTPFAFGETITPEIVNYDGNYPYASAPKGEYRVKTVPVGSLGVANGFGLFDLHGNVWEWCEDVWHGDYNGAPSDGRAWTSGGDQNRRVLRGGSWYAYGGFCRAAGRLNVAPGDRYTYLGFRVVVSARTPGLPEPAQGIAPGVPAGVQSAFRRSE